MYSADSDNEQDNDEFQDARDTCDIPSCEITLDKGLEEAQKAINYFFNNRFDEAKALMQPWSTTSMYHSVGHSVFLYLEAMLTFEQQHIATAGQALKNSLQVCNKFRKKNTLGESIGKIVKRGNYDQYTDLEAHAELCYAECLLLKSMITFMEDETLSSFIKAGIKIRSCYNSYKECQEILTMKSWTDKTTKPHFESGVKMGIGAFNLMISLLPSKIIKLLEFIGFSGNKQLGLQDLEIGYQMKGLRQILCVMTLLGYHLIVRFILTHLEGDLKLCEAIIEKQLKLYPNGVWFLFFKGRLEFMKGNLDNSIVWYTKSWKSQEIWPQFHHFCFWELLWVNCAKTDWKEASKYANYLLDSSRWSRAIYSYQKAAILLMTSETLTKADKLVISNLMKDVPKYKQKIAGKSLPMEKFVIRKAERFFSQNETLVLPMIELMYVWNAFKLLKKNFQLGENILKLIEKALRNLNYAAPSNKYDTDNRALLLLLKGTCLRQIGSPLQGLECLEQAISMQKEIQEDTYIVPYAIVELALLEWDTGNAEKAILALEDAKKNYSGYTLESRLHFRIHTALTDFKSKQDQN